MTLPATTTPDTVNFVLDIATGKAQELVEGLDRHAITVSSTTPVDCELLVESAPGEFDIADLFEVRPGAASSVVSDLVDTLGFIFESDGSGLADASTSTLSFLHDTQGVRVGTLKVQGSEQFAASSPNALCPVDVKGTLSLAQQKGASFEDITVNTSQVRIKTMDEIPSSDPLHFADIIWTVKLP